MAIQKKVCQDFFFIRLLPHIVFFGEKYRFTRQTILLLETMKNYSFAQSMLKAPWTDSIFLLDKFQWQSEPNILVYYHAKYSCQWKNWWDNKVMDTNNLACFTCEWGVGKDDYISVFSSLNIKLSFWDKIWLYKTLILSTFLSNSFSFNRRQGNATLSAYSYAHSFGWNQWVIFSVWVRSLHFWREETN